MLYVYILLGICGAAIIITLIIATAVECAKVVQCKRLFSKEKIQEYEQDLKQYFINNELSNNKSLEELCRLNDIIVVEMPQTSKRLKGREAVVYEEGDNYKIYVDECLNEKHKRFAIAHEYAHIIKGDKPLPAARDGHGFLMRSPTEQVRDYIAAAILLPMDEFKELFENANYDKCDKKGKQKFVEQVSTLKCVETDVVIRRINEYKTLVAH